MHGGHYDPHDQNTPSSGQYKNMGLADTGPTHGGAYDPNHFDALQSTGQSRGQRDNQPSMTSNPPQYAQSSQVASNYSSQTKNNDNLMNTIPMEPMERRLVGPASRLARRERSLTPVGFHSSNDEIGLLSSNDAQPESTFPYDLTEGGETYEMSHADRQSKYTSGTTFFHLDFLKRPYEGTRDDRFLDPRDGRPRRLIVQCVNTGTGSMASWSRTHVRNQSPWIFRIAHWATGAHAWVKWLPTSFALALILLNPIPVTATIRNNDFFEPVPYKDWQYPYDARNDFENPPSEGGDKKFAQSTVMKRPKGQPLVGKMERISDPQYLVLAASMKLINVQEWRRKNGDEAKLEFVMVTYTSSQFPTKKDWDYLRSVGQHAAQKAGVEAFWLGCSCLGNEREVEENVWRICDVVRGAFSVVIAVAGSVDSQADLQDPQKLPSGPLREWGDRVWTLPELLLSPERNDIVIYTNHQLNGDVQIHRRNFARFWSDSNLVGQLIDHYEGSVILSPLEHMTIALRCLQDRHTTEYLPGDLSYALMGLLRQRPYARRTDSAFQAFARLSLANDSNMLLERLVCLLPRSPYDLWNSLNDHWDASLWDIYPKTQICGLGENDSVILDGARAANIRWKKFKPVLLRGNDTWKRKIARISLSLVGPFLMIWIFLVAILAAVPVFHSLRWYIVIFTILIAPIVLLSPYLVETLYLGKVWSAQPWFFGVEGYMSLPDLERHLWGANLGRLSWSATASPLSRHKPESFQGFDNYCQGQDPASYPDIADRIKKAEISTAGEEKIFTLVDTYTMTVTLFSAIKPPVAVIVCGEEGGMQRALLCSYEWTNNTFYRETVMRMETRVFWRMAPIARVRLGLQSRGFLDI